jgi:membrane-associated phospholipid phosphatase
MVADHNTRNRVRHHACALVRAVNSLRSDCPGLDQRLRAVLLAFAALLAAGLVSALVVGDAGSVAAVHGAAWTRAHYEFLRRFTDLGLYPFYILFLAVFGWSYRERAPELRQFALAYLIAQLVGSGLTVRILKMTLGRARPDATPLPDYGSEWIGFTWDSHHHSFPSGHTADIVTSALFAALLFRNPWAAALCIIWAAALGLSRLAVAKHYPSDALAGAVIALTVSVAVVRYWLWPRLSANREFGRTLAWWREKGAAAPSL